jgi:hypothetical protein
MGTFWLKDVCEKHTVCTKGVYRFQVLDGHGSHITPDFDLFCTEHKITTLCMPAHSSHLLQPLDVGCFATLQRAYGRQIDQLMRAGVNYIDKPDFLTAYNIARTEALTPGIAGVNFKTKLGSALSLSPEADVFEMVLPFGENSISKSMYHHTQVVPRM